MIVCLIALAAAGTLCRGSAAGPYSGAYDGVPYDDPCFIGWATGIEMHWPAGFTPGGGYDNLARALGPAPGTPNDVVVFGNRGWAALTFDLVIRDGIGPDIAVFENGFNDPIFAELAYVEVSTDGVNYARFPSVSLNAWPGDYGPIDASNVHNLAGKHINNNGQAWLGTPFDLGDLATSPLVISGDVSLDNVNFVRIVDIYGHSDGTSLDEATSLIDPVTGTYYGADHVIRDGGNYGAELAGFDLDAVGILRPVPEPATMSLALVAAFSAAAWRLAGGRRKSFPG
jgi:hypothetical protein